MAIEAILWDSSSGSDVFCRACAHACRIPVGSAGRCRVRVNRDGVLFSLSSDSVVACNLDPVEKKPLYHFLPATTTFSVGTPGCNMTCSFCQNYSLSQGNVPAFSMSPQVFPENFALRAVATAGEAGASSVSFTYNEPSVSPELVLAVAPKAKEAGFASVLVSNAYMSESAINALRHYINAANFDLKSFRDAFYTDVCGARLAPVLRTISRAVDFGWWVELTTLLIPGHNDSDAELSAIARFIRENLGPQVPWHVSRFRPMHRMPSVPPTPVASLERACAIGVAEGLHFVYAGNVPGHEAENTRCPACGRMVLQRRGYQVEAAFGGECPSCGTSISGVWRKT